jgi:amidohydrolase
MKQSTMSPLPEQIRQLAAEFLPDIVAIRRHFHAHPELSMQEFQTARRLEAELMKMGVADVKRLSQTGVVGMIKGKDPSSRVVALRADMDALPIVEENDIPYRSVNLEVMHACGHDVHMASLLGTARILCSFSDQFRGSVKLIFQPSEEVPPGGAVQMIREGVLNDPPVDLIIAQHVYPGLDAGVIGMKPGPYMAATNEFYITVKGKGGHGATPDLNIDPVVIAAQIILALQQITSRFAPPLVPTVVSVGKVLAGRSPNVIPDNVHLEGILRTFDESWRTRIKEHILNISTSLASGLGGSCEVRFNDGYPALVNDEQLTERALACSRNYLGSENVKNLDLRMTAEDFAFYAQQVPACFYRLGIRNEGKGITSNLHTSTFDVDEKSIETGMGLMAWIAINELNR